MTRSIPARIPEVLAVLAVLATAAVLAASLPGVRHAADADEGVYLHYIRELQGQGLARLPDLFEEFRTDARLWRFPNPTRIGYLTFSLAWCSIFGASLAALSAFSAACNVATVALTACCARRHMDNWHAAMLTWLVGFSPLWLGLGRRALADSLAMLFAVAGWWTFLELLRRPGSWLVRTAFGASLTGMLLAKEVSVLVVLPLVATYVVERFHGRTSLSVTSLTCLLGVASALAGVAGVVAAGGVTPLFQVARIVLSSPAGNPFAQAFCAGPWYRIAVDFILISPLSTLLGLGGVLTVAIRTVRRDEQGLSAAAAILIVVTLAEFAPLIKNVRYVALLDLPLRLLALGVLSDLAGGLRERWRRPALAAAVAVLVVADLVSFFELFVAGGIYDPTSFNLLAARQMIPVR